MFVYLFRSCSSFLLICLFVYFVIVPCLLPRYLTMSLRYCIYRLFVCLFLCCFSSLLMCSFYVSAVVLLLSCYSLVRLFLRVYLISFFLGDLGHSFVDLRSVSSRGVFLAGSGVPLLCVLRTCLSRTSALAAVRFVCCLTLGVGADLVSVGGGGRERKRG